jgi:diketogulonate reductase-like aldo/keto reductase
VRQVALSFLTREPDVFAIPKAARVQHVEENAHAAELELDAQDVAAIDAAFPRGKPGPLAML